MFNNILDKLAANKKKRYSSPGFPSQPPMGGQWGATPPRTPSPSYTSPGFPSMPPRDGIGQPGYTSPGFASPMIPVPQMGSAWDDTRNLMQQKYGSFDPSTRKIAQGQPSPEELRLRTEKVMKAKEMETQMANQRNFR